MRHVGVLNVVAVSLSTVADAQGNIVYRNNAFFPIDERNFINTVTHHRCGKPGKARTRPQPPRRMAAFPPCATIMKTDADPKNRGDCVIRSARCGNSPGPHQRGATWVTPSQLVQRRRTLPPSFICQRPSTTEPSPTAGDAACSEGPSAPDRVRASRAPRRGPRGPSVCMSRRGDHRDRRGVIAQNSAS